MFASKMEPVPSIFSTRPPAAAAKEAALRKRLTTEAALREAAIAARARAFWAQNWQASTKNVLPTASMSSGLNNANAPAPVPTGFPSSHPSPRRYALPKSSMGMLSYASLVVSSARVATSRR